MIFTVSRLLDACYIFNQIKNNLSVKFFALLTLILLFSSRLYLTLQIAKKIKVSNSMSLVVERGITPKSKQRFESGLLNLTQVHFMQIVLILNN